MYFALTYLLSRLWRDVLLLPDFQRSFGLLVTPFFKRSAKVRAFFITTKKVSFYFEVFWMIFNSFCEELNRFFETECKDTIPCNSIQL